MEANTYYTTPEKTVSIYSIISQAKSPMPGLKSQRPTTKLERTGVQAKAKANNVEGVNKPMVQTDGAANEGRR